MRGLGAASIVDGLVVAFVVWPGFAAAPTINNVLYEKRSWEYWLLNVDYALVSLLARAPSSDTSAPEPAPLTSPG